MVGGKPPPPRGARCIGWTQAGFAVYHRGQASPAEMRAAGYRLTAWAMDSAYSAETGVPSALGWCRP